MNADSRFSLGEGEKVEREVVRYKRKGGGPLAFEENAGRGESDVRYEEPRQLALSQN